MRFTNMLVPGIVAGLLASLLELKVIPPRVRSLSVGMMLVLRTLAYAAVAGISLLFALRYATQRRLRIPLRELFEGEGFANFLSGADPWQLVLGFIVASFIINGVLSLTRILGPGVMPQLLLGRYVQPREEQRAFMFLDLVDATTVAERLGPLAFCDFRNDFFHDLAEPVLNTVRR
jgi:adenylate cyclase